MRKNPDKTGFNCPYFAAMVASKVRLMTDYPEIIAGLAPVKMAAGGDGLSIQGDTVLFNPEYIGRLTFGELTSELLALYFRMSSTRSV
ncbi:hypothetical protein [Roseomonas chloroacetimidivorans]|uniref:hypothetical protein n=1 Tax=Roseomonas chloroacetimidivorans TaxID=1766656 RepID=UPI003C7527BB